MSQRIALYRQKFDFAQITLWFGQNTALLALMIVFVLGGLFVPNFMTGMNLSAILFQY